MSRASKITFYTSLALTTATIIGVNYWKDVEFVARRQNIEKDEERRRQRLENQLDLERQQRIFAEYEKDQRVASGFTGPGSPGIPEGAL
ncbi:uncharacterized protein BJ171DRAFT_598702 [Polychytrium aggregatum]|uniref:uncharacterized protein n=1 Tax=Polychytrium aggregatum TaxID=110093 RepID=UPI0022FDE1D1|nr:uncharacterized protein BJ171DRAFT_598702 [Polychytrium aggregatum]KAI9205123.1 hypothetical protein BJ171DRAFT_598702 [Polychytrium aggregatum]